MERNAVQGTFTRPSGVDYSPDWVGKLPNLGSTNLPITLELQKLISSMNALRRFLIVPCFRFGGKSSIAGHSLDLAAPSVKDPNRVPLLPHFGGGFGTSIRWTDGTCCNSSNPIFHPRRRPNRRRGHNGKEHYCGNSTKCLLALACGE
jgi:hypothetical protein